MDFSCSANGLILGTVEVEVEIGLIKGLVGVVVVVVAIVVVVGVEEGEREGEGKGEKEGRAAWVSSSRPAINSMLGCSSAIMLASMSAFN